jgi:uncharacterized membrane protein
MRHMSVTDRQFRYIAVPGRSDPFVAGTAELIGGPAGEHMAGRGAHGLRWSSRFFTAARVVLLLACLTLAANWVQKADCMDGNWNNFSQYKHFCYSDVLALYYAEELNTGKLPYLEHRNEYPVLTGALMGVIGLPVYALGKADASVNQAEGFFNTTTLILGLIGVASVAAMLALRRRRPWDIALFSLSPALVVTAAVNWDLFAVGFAVFGLWAWARHRPVLAGTLIGLGVAAKLWPGALLIALWMIYFHRSDPRARRPLLVATASATIAWLVVNVPVLVAAPRGWWEFFHLNSTRGIDWGTLWYIGAHFPHLNSNEQGLPGFGWLGQHIQFLNVLTYALMFAAWAVVGRLVLLAPRRPRVAQVAFLVVAIFLVFSKVWSQQYVLWLLPLAVLAKPRWTPFLIWQFTEVCYFFAFYGELMNASGKFVFPEGTFVTAALLRMTGVLVMMISVIKDIQRPSRDEVWLTYGDDPDGGPLGDLPPEVRRRRAPLPAYATPAPFVR